jgi:hypothetical protein
MSIKMLTIEEWIEQGLTTLKVRAMQKKVVRGEFEGVERVGKRLVRIPTTATNLEAAKRQRSPQILGDSSQKCNNDDVDPLT